MVLFALELSNFSRRRIPIGKEDQGEMGTGELQQAWSLPQLLRMFSSYMTPSLSVYYMFPWASEMT